MFIVHQMELIFIISTFLHDQQGTRTELPRLLTELFKAVDENVDGELSPRELVEVETKLGRSITEADAEDIIKTWDCNGDGKMDINEFIEYKTATMRFSL